MKMEYKKYKAENFNINPLKIGKNTDKINVFVEKMKNKIYNNGK